MYLYVYSRERYFGRLSSPPNCAYDSKLSQALTSNLILCCTVSHNCNIICYLKSKVSKPISILSCFVHVRSRYHCCVDTHRNDKYISLFLSLSVVSGTTGVRCVTGVTPSRIRMYAKEEITMTSKKGITYHPCIADLLYCSSRFPA